MRELAAPSARVVVLDTNVVLDLLVFCDPSTEALRSALASGRWVWIATQAMRAELQRVSTYPTIARAMALRDLQAAQVLEKFDRTRLAQAAAPPCPARCSDPDDQPFIDLAVAQRALLVSKDAAVLRMRRRLASLGVAVQSIFTSAM